MPASFSRRDLLSNSRFGHRISGKAIIFRNESGPETRVTRDNVRKYVAGFVVVGPHELGPQFIPVPSLPINDPTHPEAGPAPLAERPIATASRPFQKWYG
jgi:hypothetical protein